MLAISPKISYTTYVVKCEDLTSGEIYISPLYSVLQNLSNKIKLS